MTEEEFEDMLGVKYGWPEPMGVPRWPLVIPLIAWVVIIALVLAAAFYSAHALAQEKTTYSATDGSGNLVRITLEPCPEAPTWLNLHRAEMRYEGIDYAACWLFMAGMVIVIDSNEDATPIPMAQFKKDEPI